MTEEPSDTTEGKPPLTLTFLF